MSETSLFSNPFLLGFDYLEAALDSIGKSSADGYPPYNIEQSDGSTWRIILAVAGFSVGDLKLTLEDNQLLIQGSQPDDGDRSYIYRGIAARRFQRRFVLADGMKVESARLNNGLLEITLVRPRNKPSIREIEIVTGD